MAKQQFGAHRSIVSKTAAYTILRGESGTFFDNTGAGGSVELALPLDHQAGDWFRVRRVAAQSIFVAPGAGNTITCADASGAYGAQTADKHVILDAVGDDVEVTSDGNNNWNLTNHSDGGDITVES